MGKARLRAIIPARVAVAHTQTRAVPWMRRFLKLGLIVAVVACVCPPAVAATEANPTPSPLTDYRIASWTGGDGITLGEVRSITQDANGYLWLATEHGLVRFDGLRFATADLVTGSTPLPNSPTRAVYLARDGALWVGYAEGHGLYRILDGEVREVHLKGGIPAYVNVITESQDGTLLVGHDHGLIRLVNGRWQELALLSVNPTVNVLDVMQDHRGVVWIATGSGLYRGDGEQFEPVTEVSTLTKAISEDRTGRVWTTDESTGFRRADIVHRPYPFEARGMDLFHDSQGNLWVTTRGQGLWRVKHDAAGPEPPLLGRVTEQNGLASDENSAIFEDRSGNIWVASIQGLSRLAPHKTTSVIDIGVVHALAVGSDGTAWAGTTRGLVKLDGVTPQSSGTVRNVSTSAVSAVHVARDGTVWAASDGLYKLAAGRLQRVSAEGPRPTRITSIDSDAEGLWLCDELLGVVRLANGRFVRVAVGASAASARPVFLRVDDASRVWVAFRGGALIVIHSDGTFQEFGPQQGLSHRSIHTIYQDRQGEIWVGGTAGLSRLIGDRFETLSFKHEVRNWPVASVIDDDEGGLWIAFAFFGFIHAAREDAIRASADPSLSLKYRLYNTAHAAGYPDVFYGGASARGADGALWFLMSRGVAMFDPRRFRDAVRGSELPRIEGISADERRFRAVNDVTLPARTSRLRIDYTVVNLSSPERIRFRYRLDGFDTAWVDGASQRQALYTNLPPGSYRFRVQASTNALIWNESESGWTFSIAPTFYQSRWFYALCIVGLLLGGVGAWRLRVRHIRKEFALVFGERLRLSREIHDTLLQGMYGIALQLDVASDELRDRVSPVSTYLRSIRRQIEDYIAEARRSISDLRSPMLDRRDLVSALREMGEGLTGGKVSFSLKVTGMPRRCEPKLETQVLRIGHEAIINAVHHAQAKQVEVEIGFDRRLLRLQVTDDGQGLIGNEVETSVGAQHYGLVSMKERAAYAGGRCTIDSSPGAGVRVLAEFPLGPAA